MSHLQGPWRLRMPGAANVAMHPRDGSPHSQLPIHVMIRRLHLSAEQGSTSLRMKPPIASQFFDHRATSLRPMQDEAMLDNARNPSRRRE
ncbi:hypothetical protein K469DRAFT_720692 [Zopfia rhizophila CBS 207.26]|uniref:Uncharacterized protein n=1 Tax=Zopfia rhizophila CBS 207.26 TaxID=1314779 RepID=A0A6A6DHC6_9PEZI|nr:hypothetical protein K469DRAFT_720692 [Zopfia rhizophila CBS 207.26]